MERLTYFKDGYWRVNFSGVQYQADFVDRLAAYEDIAELCGGFDRLRELAEADKDRRVVVLPCKTVFELTWDAGPDCDLVCPVSIAGNGCCDFCDKGKLFAYEIPCCQEHIERLGETVFLTREEAEKAMEVSE